MGVGNYDPMTVAIVSGRIAITIRYTGNAGGSSQLATASPDTNGERICTVNLQITNPSLNAGLSWDISNSAILTTSSLSVGQAFLGADNNPLPVQLASFTGRLNQQGQVRLDWRTLTETSNYGFYVQKSWRNQNSYQTVSSLIPGHGTTVEPHDYTWTDLNTLSGVWYYRLRQVDLDGTEHFSEGIVPAGITNVSERLLPREFSLGQNFPNPFNPSTQIEFAVPHESRVRLEVYNLLGQRVGVLVDDVRYAGFHTVRFDASGIPNGLSTNGRRLDSASGYASGVYFYKMTADGSVSLVRKMVVMK